MEEKEFTWDARDEAAMVLAAITIALLFPIVAPVATILNGLAIALAPAVTIINALIIAVVLRAAVRVHS